MKLTKSSRALRRATAFVLAAALTLSAPVATSASAASKKVPSLSVKKKTLYFNKAAKKSFTLKVKKNKVKLVKTKWTTSKKSVAKLSGKKKTKVKVTAKKKGTAKITAKVTYKAGSKKKTKKLVCKVTSKKAKAPVKTDTPVATSSSTAAPTDAPNVTDAPTQNPTTEPTKVPTAEPTATAKAEELKVTAVTVITSTKVNVTFSKAIDKTTDASKFTISDGATVSGVELNADNTVATLVINGLTANKEYTLTVKGVTSGDAKLDSYETKFTAKTDEYALDMDDGIENGNVMKADGKTTTKVTVKLVDSNGELVKDVDQVELDFYTTAGTFANKTVTVQKGIAENTFTSESLVAAKTAKIMVTIINAKDKNLLNVSNTMNIVLDPNPETTVDDTVGATLTDIKVQTADKVALFFNKVVKVTDYTKNDKVTNNIYGYDATKMEIEVTDGAKKATVPVIGLSAIEGNDKALYAHLATGTTYQTLKQLTDNADITVKVIDKTKVPVTATKTALLQDITNPSVLSVTNNGLTQIILTFSEAVNPFTGASAADKENNYVIDGIPLSNTDVWGTGAQAVPGTFDLKSGADSKNIVQITLGKKNGKQVYLSAGKHSILVSNIGDAANVTDSDRNKLITQTLDFNIDKDDSLVTGEVTVQSPEQYVVTLNKDFGTEMADEAVRALLAEHMKLQKWNSTTSKYENVADPDFNVRCDPRLYGGDPKKFIVELKKDWTKVYDTANSHKNYYNDQYRLFIPKGVIENPANGKMNEDIVMLLDSDIMKNPDVTSPEIKDVKVSNAANKEYVISFSEPVQVPGKNAVAVTPNQRQDSVAGVPMPNVVFIKSDNSVTVPATISYNWTYDDAIIVTPSADLTAGKWKVVVYSISDDVGNTAATLVKDDFEIKADVIVEDAFRPLWVVAVPASQADPIKGGFVPANEDVIYVKYSQNIATAGGSANVINTANYQVDGYVIPTGTKIDNVIDGYNNDVAKVYGANGMKDTIAIHLAKGTLASDSNSINLAPTMESAKGSKIQNAGQKTLEKQGAFADDNVFFKWNYTTIAHHAVNSPLKKVDDVKKALADDKYVNITTDTALDKNDAVLEIKRAMTIDFAGSTIKSLNIDSQTTGKIVVKNLNATDIDINAPYADVEFENVVTTGKVNLKNVLTKLVLKGTTTFAVFNILSDVKHDILVQGVGASVTLTVVNNYADAEVTFDPLTIGTLNQISPKKLILDNITLTTLNIKAAASLSLANNQSTITNINIAKDVKLAEYSVDVEHGVTVPASTVKTGVVFNPTTGEITTPGTPAAGESDYITGGVITKNIAEKPITLSAGNFTNLANCTVAVASTGAAVTVSNYNQNAKLTVQMDAGISIKDYKGISFDFVADRALNSQWNEFWLQMVKTGGDGNLAAAFYPSSEASNSNANVAIAHQGATIAANTKTTVKLAFDWAKKADILQAQLAEGAEVQLGLQLSGLETGNFTISNVKLYV